MQNQEGHSAWQYFIQKVVAVVAVLLVCLIGFFIAQRRTSCSVMAGEAMTARINYAFQKKSVSKEALSRYFTKRMIDSGELDKLKETYKDFSISDYNESSTVLKVSSYLFGSATVRMEETVAGVSGVAKTQTSSDTEPKIPDWQNGEYKIVLKREKGKWLVDKITLTKEAEKEVKKTPKPSSTSTSTASAKPSAT